MKGPDFKERFRLFVVTGAAICPAFLIAWFVWTCSVDVPFWDEWALLPMLQKSFTGELTWAELFEQHNEHRIFFPRLLYIAIAHLWGFNVVIPMFLNFLLACVIAFSFFRVQLKTILLPLEHRLAIWFLANLVLFTPFQSHAWLWGICVTNSIPLLALSLCLWVSYSSLTQTWKFLLCAGLSFFATFSTGNGMLTWALAFPLLFKADSWPRVFQRKWAMLLWITLAIGCATFYFKGYVKPTLHPSLASAWDSPLVAMRYFLAFLGAPLGHGSGIIPQILSKFAGIILLGLYGPLCAYVAWQRQYDLFERALPWIVLGLYSLINAAAITIGRTGFGLDQALSPRYAVFSVALVIATIHLFTLVSTHAQSHAPTRKLEIPWNALGGGLAALLLVLHVQSSDPGLKELSGLRNERLRMKASVALIDIGPSEPLSRMFFPAYAILRESALRADQRNLFHPRLVTGRRVASIATPLGLNAGDIDAIERTAAGSVKIKGWALAPSKTRPADGLILSRKQSGEEVFIDVIDSRVRRDDLVPLIGKENVFCGFEWEISAGKMTEGARFRVWAYDAASGKAHAVTKELMHLPK